MAFLLGDHERDPLFLQAKEAGPSALEQFVGPSEYDNAGQRVVVGQRLMQAVSDIFLGWVRVKGFDGQTRDFYLHQLRDWKGSAEIEVMIDAAAEGKGSGDLGVVGAAGPLWTAAAGAAGPPSPPTRSSPCARTPRQPRLGGQLRTRDELVHPGSGVSGWARSV